MRALIGLLIITAISHAAVRESIIFSPGFIGQKENMIDFNIGYGYIDSGSGLAGINGVAAVRIGVERSVAADHAITAPKFGVEGTFIILTARLNIAHYSSENKRDTRLIPEIGLAWRNYCSLTYGHSLHISGDKIDKVGKDRIGFNINIPFEID